MKRTTVTDDIPEQPIYPEHDTCPECGCLKRRGTDCRVANCPDDSHEDIQERFEQVRDLALERGKLCLSIEKASILAAHMWLVRDGNKERYFERHVGGAVLLLRVDDCFGFGVVEVETVATRTKKRLQAAIDAMQQGRGKKVAAAIIRGDEVAA